jgi:hypothetical protein
LGIGLQNNPVEDVKNNMRKCLSALWMTGLAIVLGSSPARADILYVGSDYNTFQFVNNGHEQAEGGGSVDVSTLNGQTLPFVYCVEINTVVYVPDTYSQTVVTTNGQIHGQTITNDGEVAWLLDHYASPTAAMSESAAKAAAEIALQAAIWHVIFNDSTHDYHLNDQVDSTAHSAYLLYNQYLTALGTNTGNVAAYDWMSPEHTTGDLYQGLVTSVPEPTSIIQLGAFLAVGLLGFGAKCKFA